MKRILLFLTILTIAVFCSACINNYAIQQLNQIAKQYSDHGDMQSAIARLESSVDLDGNVFESRYNLAVAYMDVKQCDKALEQINKAQELLQTEDASIYYIQAVANSCLADNILNSTNTNDDEQNKAKKYVNYLKDANIAYDKYIKLASLTENTDAMVAIFNSNEEKIKEYSEKYGL